MRWDLYDELTAALGNITLLARDDGVALPEDQIQRLTLTKLETLLKPYFDTLYPVYNYAINGGFDFAQRQTPGTLTTIADNKYSADRWRVTRENADVQYQRNDATGEAGLTSRYYGTFKKISNIGKIHICQVVESMNSIPLRGKTVTFQIKMKASASKTIRMAILELTNAGTIDAIPATLVTAFGANAVDPTLGANVAVITAAESKAVTTAWQSFAISITVPNNSKNILLAIWTDSQFAINDSLSLAEGGVFVSSAIQPWKPRLIQDELALCQRYFYSTYDLDVAPGTNAASGMIAFAASLTATLRGACLFPVPMRATPTTIVYSYLGTANKVANAAGAEVGTICTLTASQRSCAVVGDSGSGFTVGAMYLFSFTANAEM